MGEEQPAVPVKAKVFLIDPASMQVAWMNESAAEGAAQPDENGRLSVVQAVPVAEAMGVPAALAAVSADGVPRHLVADVVSMARGSITLATSVYQLPDGALLVVTENAWQASQSSSAGTARRAPRRGR